MYPPPSCQPWAGRTHCSLPALGTSDPGVSHAGNDSGPQECRAGCRTLPVAQGPAVGGLWLRLPGKPPPPGPGWASHWLPTRGRLRWGKAARLPHRLRQPLRKYRCQMLCFFHRTRGRREVTGKRLTRPDPQWSHHVWGRGAGPCLMAPVRLPGLCRVPCEGLARGLPWTGPALCGAHAARPAWHTAAPWPCHLLLASLEGPSPSLNQDRGLSWDPRDTSGCLASSVGPPLPQPTQGTEIPPFTKVVVGHPPCRHHAANSVKQTVMAGRGLTSL